MTYIIAETDVMAGVNNQGQFFQFRRLNGMLQSRKVELFTHGPERVGAWANIDGTEPTRGLPEDIAAEIEL